MSDYLPFEIQVEIIKHLPVKSLIRFQSVCKSWKSLIQRSDFIADYSSKVQHLLVRYVDAENLERKCILIVDDDTFPHQKVSVTIPLSVKTLKHCITVGTSHGLLCSYGDLQEGRDGPVSGTCRAVLWNPSVRKSVDVIVPNVANGIIYGTILGFGVCRETNDPKIVKITLTNSLRDVERKSCIPWQVEVFALSTRAWRRPYSNLNLPRKSIRFDRKQQVVVDGFLYWLATDRIAENDELGSNYLIVSFDMTSEEFSEVNLPDSLEHNFVNRLSMCKLRESLVVVEQSVEGIYNMAFGVWMMENGVFTKLYTVNIPSTSLTFAREFRKTGELVIEILHDFFISRSLMSLGSLAAYDPYSKSVNNVGVSGRHLSFCVYSYMESLLLL